MAGVSLMSARLDVTNAVEALVGIGLDAVCAEDALTAAAEDDDREALAEFALLCFESDAAIMLDASVGVGDVLAELCDGCRRAGAALEVVATETGPAVRGQGEGYAYHVRDDAGSRLAELCGAVSLLLPDNISLWLPSDFAADADSLAVIVLTEDELEAVMGCVSGSGFNEIFVAPPAPAAPSPLTPPQMVEEAPLASLYGAHPPATAGESWQELWQRLVDLDPACPWPVEAARPPGDDFYALTMALCGQPLAKCIAGAGDLAWATLLFRWALATHVGCRWDVLACRFNPGMAAQGLLGMGQLTWAYLVLEALGALPLATRVGELLDNAWVRPQERCRLTARQRAYYDLGEFMRTGKRGLQLGRVSELAALAEPGAFEDPEQIEAALRAHTLPWGDQFTHQPLYWAWPAPIYAFARRAGALDRLDRHNPFFAHPVGMDEVDMEDVVVRGLVALEGKLRAAERRSLPPLLDPLPVIVEVRVTACEGEDVLGHTVLPDAGGAEHSVRARRGECQPRPGELWAFRVEAGHQGVDRHPIRVQGRTVVPTGCWIERLE